MVDQNQTPTQSEQPAALPPLLSPQVQATPSVTNQSLWQKFKNGFEAVGAIAALVLGYLFFFKRQMPDMPPRPSKYPGGDEKPVIPDAPPQIDWDKRRADDENKAKKAEDRLDSDKELVDDINRRYPQ